MESFRDRNALPPGTELGNYVLVSARERGKGDREELGSGTYGIVYLARHRVRAEWLYAVKEFFPSALVVRDREDDASVVPVTTEAEAAFADGMARFQQEAESLRRFRNERHVVSCVDFLEANGTAYVVMDYDDGVPLSRYVGDRESSDRPFGEKDLLAVARPLLEVLSVVHAKGVLHRDIKPGNVFVRRQDDDLGRPAEPVLMDFGAAKQQYLSRDSGSNAPYTEGYAAPEQQTGSSAMTPSTDLYGLGAVLWRLVAGGAPDHPGLLRAGGSEHAAPGELAWDPEPVDALRRMGELFAGRPDPMPSALELGHGRFSESVLEAIDRCLFVEARDRPQSCKELDAMLGASVAAGGGASSPGGESPGGAEPVPDEGAGAASGTEEGLAHRPFGRRRLSLVAAGLAAALTAAVIYQVAKQREPTLTELPQESPAVPLGEPVPPPDLLVEVTEPEEEVPREPVAIRKGTEQPETGPDSSAATREERGRRPPAPVRNPPAIVGGLAILDVETEPAGAEVFVNGQKLGETPLLREDLHAGSWEVTLRHPYFETLALPDQTFLDDRVLRIERTLTRGTGDLTVLTDPGGAWLEREGVRLAEDTPVTLEGLPAGPLELTLGAEEHRSVQVQTEVPMGGVGRLEHRLERIPYGSLTLELVPADASVSFEDSSRTYDAGMRLPQGTYGLTVSRAGYHEASLTMEVSGVTRRRVQLDQLRSGDTFRDELRSGGSGPEMVVVPPGQYLMGCVSGMESSALQPSLSGRDPRSRRTGPSPPPPPPPPLCDDNEQPVHEVRISESFAVGKYEVTFAEWDECVSAGGCVHRPADEDWGRARRPVINVSWNDVQEYVRWLSSETGTEYRLLSESEWEYTARAGASTVYSWGDEVGSDHANCGHCGSRWDARQTAPVGSFGPNAFGLHDTHGNAWEWVDDCWNESYEGAPSNGSAWQSGDCSNRVYRGGSWYSRPALLRSANRSGSSTGSRDDSLGFRVARTLSP